MSNLLEHWAHPHGLSIYELALTAFLATLVSFGAALFSVGYVRVVAAGWRGKLRELENSDVVGESVACNRRTLLGKLIFCC